MEWGGLGGREVKMGKEGEKKERELKKVGVRKKKGQARRIGAGTGLRDHPVALFQSWLCVRVTWGAFG